MQSLSYMPGMNKMLNDFLIGKWNERLHVSKLPTRWDSFQADPTIKNCEYVEFELPAIVMHALSLNYRCPNKNNVYIKAHIIYNTWPYCAHFQLHIQIWPLD